MRYTDRSRTELDWTCPRARFWGYEWEGIGLAPLVTPDELDFGLKMAEQTANIKLGKPWSVSAFAGEKANVATALLTGYEIIIWPRWLRDFDLVSVEEEQPLPLTDWLTYNSRPDTIMRRKSDGTFWYGPEDKTTAYVDSLLNYANSVQLHATAKAIEHNKKIEISGCLVQGLYKGFEKEGRLYHPLVYAYCKEGRPGIVPDQWSSKYVRGWERTPTSQYPGGVRGWIESRKPEELAESFPNSEPVMIKKQLVEAYFNQLVMRERRIAQLALDTAINKQPDANMMDDVFPQHFNQCDGFSKGRKPCTFKDACFNQTAKRFPLSFYQKRKPHHPEEQNENQPHQ